MEEFNVEFVDLVVGRIKGVVEEVKCLGLKFLGSCFYYVFFLYSFCLKVRSSDLSFREGDF